MKEGAVEAYRGPRIGFGRRVDLKVALVQRQEHGMRRARAHDPHEDPNELPLDVGPPGRPHHAGDFQRAETRPGRRV